MRDLSPADIALRVAIFSGVLGIIGWSPPGVHLLVGGVMTLAALALFYEAWTRRKSSRALRMNLIWGLMATGGAFLLVSGLVGYLGTSLLALAGVCLALTAVAKLGESDETPPE